MAWVVAATVWSLLSLGIGLLIGRRLPGSLLLPVGFAGVVVIGSFCVLTPTTASLIIPIVAVCAAVGGYLGRARLTPRLALPAGLTAIAVYVLYGLPTIISGAPFTGWIKLDDGATWLAFSDRLATAGRTTVGLNPSTYEAVLQINWESGNAGGAYPMGIFPPLGAMSSVLGVDAAWLLQPYLAFLAALLALAIYAVLRDAVASTSLRSALSVLAATPALLLGYAFWGGIKEMALAPLFVLVAVLAVSRLGTAALAMASAAVLLIAGFSGGVWIALPLLVWLVLTLRARAWQSLVVMVLVTAVASTPMLIGFSPHAVSSLLHFASAGQDIGNLTGPLSRLQVLGIWPVGDFRDVPQLAPVVALLVAVMGLAALGVWAAWRQKHWELPVYVGNVLLIAMVFAGGNAWIGGKALAMASPAPLVAAAAGIGWLWSRRRVVEAGAGLGLVTVGVVWSYALAYHQVWLAPAGQLRELREIGRDDTLQAPALMVEYSPYGVRHFLRELDAEGAGELRRRVIPTVEGGTVEKAAYADIDQISQEALADFPTLVLRRSPIASRPPSDYSLVSTGQFYEVWARDQDAPVVLSHLPLGDQADPAAVPKCSVIQQIAATAAPGDEVAYVERSPLVVVPLGPDAVMVPAGNTTTSETFEVAEAGEYQVALGGSFAGEVTLRVDGTQIWTGRHQLNWTGNTTPAGSVELTPGEHELTLEYSVNRLQPGTGSGPWPLGPVYLSPRGFAVQTVDPVDAGQLCGKRLDWVEVVRPRPN